MLHNEKLSALQRILSALQRLKSICRIALWHYDSKSKERRNAEEIAEVVSKMTKGWNRMLTLEERDGISKWEKNICLES